MYEKTVTVFNHYDTSTGGMWFPHVIRNVDLVTDKAELIKKYGPGTGDAAKLHIVYTPDGNDVMINTTRGEIPWYPPKMWAGQVNDDLSDSITFSEGDFFMLGEWYGEDPVMEDDYIDRRYEGFYGYMNASHDYVYMITSIGGPYTVIPHFEIMGK